MNEELCPAHGATATSLESIAAAVLRLEAAQSNTSDVQIEMARSLAVMAKTLEKVEHSDIAIERLNGKLDAMLAAFDKSEKEHDDIFERLRALEQIASNPRLAKLEVRQEKQLWGLVATVAAAALITVVKAVWK